MIKMVLAITVLVMVNVNSGYAEGIKVPDNVLMQIKHINRQAVILSKDDIDLNECEVSNINPGIVKDDFNGDGIADYAVLLSMPIIADNGTGNKAINSRIKLIVFVATKANLFNRVTLYEADDYLPAINFIKLQKPGQIKSMSNKYKKINNSSIKFVTCGKSAVVYFWDKYKFREFWTAD